MCPELSITASALLNAVLSAMKLRRSRTSAPETGDAVVAVSYTHLTLPTICSV